MQQSAAALTAASPNPFSTRFVQPGRIEYRFPSGQGAEAIVDRLRAHGWRGAIVGPHGVGKSTLLAALAPHLEYAGRRVVQVALHDGQRRWPTELEIWRSWTPTTQVIVDGYEQLGLFARAKLNRWVRRAGCGLLATAHRDVKLPVVYRAAVDRQAVAQIVAWLQRDAGVVVTQGDTVKLLAARGDDVRETLFGLYDLYEARRRRGA
jgi:hypothetical protein